MSDKISTDKISTDKMADKCQACSRKTHFVIKCKCEKLVCIAHRDPYDHNCTFDYKPEWTAKLVKDNPVIQKNKIEVI